MGDPRRTNGFWNLDPRLLQYKHHDCTYFDSTQYQVPGTVLYCAYSTRVPLGLKCNVCFGWCGVGKIIKGGTTGTAVLYIVVHTS